MPGERGPPTGLAVKCCSPASPEHLRLASAPARRPLLLSQESADTASPVGASSLPTPRGAPAGTHMPAAQPAVARRRSRDERRRRLRNTSSDDDEHNTSNPFLASVHALVAPALLPGLAEVDIFTIMWQDYPPADQASTLCDVDLEVLGLVDLCEPCRLQSSSAGGRARALTCSAHFSSASACSSSRRDRRERPFAEARAVFPVLTTLPSPLFALPFCFQRRQADEQVVDA